ncbi:small integral membrane protein 11-like [Echinops telfairi]|uniref:Small integral membrane protein 11-like n=1 Tax=Echinops telfairi TaxID=9371 RepID=A0AC55CKZ7_ECHTE|nr:small integral membrane protein 11-like [Echinops telfairi]
MNCQVLDHVPALPSLAAKPLILCLALRRRLEAKRQRLEAEKKKQ